MKRLSIVGLILFAVLLLIAGCGPSIPKGTTSPTEVKPIPSGTEEKMVWSSQDKRPAWLYNEPDVEGGDLFFIGLSGKYAGEKEARNDAQMTAINNVVKYIGTSAQNKFQRLQASYGLTSEIIDPTTVSRQLEEQLSGAFATRVKAKEWYIEKWENKLKENFFLAFLLAKVPKSSIDQAYDDLMDNNTDALKKKRDAANDAKAKAQFENAMKLFEEAKKQGFSIDDK